MSSFLRPAKLVPPAKLVTLVALVAATLWPADLLAQRRVVRRGGGRPVVVVSRPYYRPYFYSPFYYGGFYSPFWGPYYQYPYPYYGRWAYDTTGAARLKVTPRNTQVYIDGYFVGLVDDFDGNFQRLNIEAGEHELQLYLEGYRPFNLKVLFVRGRTVNIEHVMEPVGPGEQSPGPPTPTETQTRAQPYGRTSPRPGARPPARVGQASQFGSLLLRVRPSDATVLVDGEEWEAPSGEDQVVIELAEGEHRIEVRKSGFQTYATVVRVRRGETVRLNVSLTAAGLSGEF